MSKFLTITDDAAARLQALLRPGPIDLRRLGNDPPIVPWDFAGVFVYKTTAAPAGGTVTAKRVDSAGAVQGNNETFYVL